MTVRKIKLNAIRCAHCGLVVISKYGHDFATHSCVGIRAVSGEDAYIAADGGRNYLRRVGNRGDWVEASEYDDGE